MRDSVISNCIGVEARGKLGYEDPEGHTPDSIWES